MSSGEKDARGDAALERKIVSWARIVVPAVAIAAALVAGKFQGPPLAVLILAGAALVGVIATFWSSLRALLGETELSGADAYAIAAPRAEEEQKRAVLRALKDLEFERSVGKISDDDYGVLVTQYRAEAKRLLRVLDEQAEPRRERAERLVAERLRREGIAEAKDAADAKGAAAKDDAEDAGEAPKPAAEIKQVRVGRRKRRGGIEIKGVPVATAPEPAQTKAAVVCDACGTSNDADAVFCKKCGKKQGETSDAKDDKPSATARESADEDDAEKSS